MWAGLLVSSQVVVLVEIFVGWLATVVLAAALLGVGATVAVVEVRHRRSVGERASALSGRSLAVAFALTLGTVGITLAVLVREKWWGLALPLLGTLGVMSYIRLAATATSENRVD